MRKSDIFFKILVRFIICTCLFIPNVSAQGQVNINGKVSDSDGAEIPGVNIVIKGTTDGTITDLDGNYQLSVPGPDVVLIYSFVGYKSKEITVGDKKVINVTLETGDIGIEDVVVVGYGTTKKSDLTGAIVSVDSEKLLSRPVVRVDQALQSQAAGVQVAATSGLPGSGSNIRIRGHGALNTNNGPLWVIDGYIGGDINSIAPENIQSIEILKDASASIYGARAANGVILVTTKRGKKNTNSVSVNYYKQFSNVGKTLDLLDASQWMTLRNRALEASGLPTAYTDAQIKGDSVSNIGYIADTDWQKAIFRTAETDYVTVSFLGGSDKTSYSLSGNFQRAEGIIIDSDFKRGGIRANIDHEISKKLKIGLNTNIYRTIQNRFDIPTGWGQGAAGGAVNSPPYYPLYDSLGNYYNLSSWDNPVLQALLQDDQRTTSATVGNVFITYEPIPGLMLKADFGGEINNFMRRNFISGQLFAATQTVALTKAQVSNTKTDKWFGTFTATYEKTIADDHKIKVLAGIEQNVKEAYTFNANGTDMKRETLLWNNLNAFNDEYNTIGSNAWSEVTQSGFGRLDYSLYNKYLLEATFRRDGSSKFGPNYKWGNFVAFSGAWKIKNENFMQSIEKISQLKLRASWGQSGNDDINRYRWLETIALGAPRSGYTFGAIGSSGGETEYVGATIDKIANSSVHWEKGEISNIGIDFGLFDDRITGSVDIYQRVTRELLFNKGLPLYTGYGDGWSGGVTVVSNIAKMRNRGIEMQVSANVLSYKDFLWDIDANFSLNRNMVVKLADGNPITYRDGQIIVEEGRTIGNIYGYYTDGLFQEGDDIDGTPRHSGDESIGDQRYVDSNGNGVLSLADQGIIGNALPDYTYGIVNNFSFKGFRLSTIITGSVGADLYNNTKQKLSNGQLGENNGGAWLMNSWTPENTNTDIPRMNDGYTEYVNDRFIEDASFIKISNIELSYNFPQHFLQKAKLSNFMLYISLQNYFTFTKYSGADPEVYSTSTDKSNNMILGIDSQSYPTPKSITMGVKFGI